MDDVFDEGDEQFEKKIATNEWKQIKSQFENVGYLEGLEASKEDTVQFGFDEGYHLSASVGFELGKLFGIVSILRSATQNDDEETKAELEKLFQELSKAKGFQFFSEPFLVKKVSEFQYDGDKEQLEKKSCGNGACCNSCSNKPKPETEDSPKPSLENHTQKLESYKTQIKNILQKQGKTFEF